MYNLIQDGSISDTYYLNKLHQILLQKLESARLITRKLI
ncbi:hypothetical protein MmTuc01_2319 [Methanosarcina mazei Tuc01]|uniref:Uncharacterized protein n=1 Tax=Methanosarcina mazei Tuc01 TaxID=1236903 RepID=M1PZ60_METMZ|nr:hypothetical protein MmTuc01_2319 [Methanosarcina mazei Tuc01]